MHRPLALVFLALLLHAGPAATQTVDLRDELLRDWLAMKDSMHELADEMPEEAFSYRPTAEQRSFGQQVLHVANANVLNLRFLGSTEPAPAIDRSATRTADVIAAMDASFDYGTAILKSHADDWLMETVPTNDFLGPSTRARVVWFLLGHSWDIYGQMVVYLRLNGGVPPASQRP